MRKFGVLACLLASTLVTNVANGQTEPAAPPANWRALVARHMLQKYDLSNIREAGITTPAYVFTTIWQGHGWALCVATMYDDNRYRVYELSFAKDGKVSDMGEVSVRPGGRLGPPGAKASVGRTKIGNFRYCRYATTSPFPEIVRGKR